MRLLKSLFVFIIIGGLLFLRYDYKNVADCDLRIDTPINVTDKNIDITVINDSCSSNIKTYIIKFDIIKVVEGESKKFSYNNQFEISNQNIVIDTSSIDLPQENKRMQSISLQVKGLIFTKEVDDTFFGY
jgi:hypothetical protein